MITISPSLLACDFLNIETEINHLNQIENLWLHLDIMDGHFVPNLTFGEPIVEKISKISKHKLDAHLMVTNPKFHIEQMKNMNLHNITFHIECFQSQQEILDTIAYAKNYYPSVGISIKPKTDPNSIGKEIYQAIDLLLVMSVEPGFGGQGFIESTYAKLEQISQIKKDISANFIIQIDGGISDKNSKEVIKLGVSNLVAGSYVFKNGPSKYKEQIEKLY